MTCLTLMDLSRVLTTYVRWYTRRWKLRITMNWTARRNDLMRRTVLNRWWMRLAMVRRMSRLLYLLFCLIGMILCGRVVRLTMLLIVLKVFRIVRTMIMRRRLDLTCRIRLIRLSAYVGRRWSRLVSRFGLSG